MFAGHIGAALAIGRVERRVNLGVLVLAALLLDLVLWVLVLLGWESVTIPADYAATHQLEFVFPYSHGLLATLAWSAVAAVVTLLWCARQGVAKVRPAAFVALAVFSHWLLDVLVHIPELPLTGEGSPKVGLGLSIPFALVVESVITVAGLGLFLSGAGLPRARQLWLVVLSLAVLALTVAGMTVAPPPPSGTAVAASSLATIVVVCGLAGWLGRRATGQKHPPPQ